MKKKLLIVIVLLLGFVCLINITHSQEFPINRSVTSWWPTLSGTNIVGWTGGDQSLTALTNAIAATPARTELHISNSITATGLVGPLISLDKGITLSGPGEYGGISVAATVPATEDIIQVYGTSVRKSVFRNLYIQPASGNPGRHWLVAKTDSAHSLQNLEMENCFVSNSTYTGTGYAIKVDSTNNNGLAFARIINNVLYGGIYGIGMGDSCFIDRNNIKGKNRGVYLEMINAALGQAATLTFTDNNIVNDEGAGWFKYGYNWMIRANNTEQQTVATTALKTAGTNYMFIMEQCGDFSYGGGKFLDNKVGATDLKYFNGLKLDNCQGVIVDSNSFYQGRGDIANGYRSAAINVTGFRSHGNRLINNKIFVANLGQGIHVSHTALRTDIIGNTIETAQLGDYEVMCNGTDFMMDVVDLGKETVGVRRWFVETRKDSVYYNKGQIVERTVGGDDIWLCVQSGVSDASAPASAAVNTLVTDNSVYWLVLSQNSTDVPNAAYFRAAFGYLGTGWYNYSKHSAYKERLSYIKNPDGTVHLSGLVSKGLVQDVADGEVIATLPVGFRAGVSWEFPMLDNVNTAEAFGRIVYNANGGAGNGTLISVGARTGTSYLIVDATYQSNNNFDNIGTLTGSVAANGTVLPMNTVSGINVGDIVAIKYDATAGYRLFQTIALAVASPNVTVMDPLPDGAASGSYVYVYRPGRF